MIKRLFRSEQTLLQTGLLLVLTFLFLSSFYSEILFSPGQHIFQTKGDALKNYYTFSYFLKHNESWTDLEGMNYPFGEHILYTDGHPVLSWMLRSLKPVFPALSDHGVTVINVLILLSYLLAPCFLFFILKGLGVDRLLSILASLAIIMLSPQIYRMGGHFALAYVCAFPLQWFLLFKFNASPSFKRGLLLFINAFIWLFTHAYLGMILIGFTFLFQFGKKLFISAERKKWSRADLGLFLSYSLPVALFMLFLKSSDTHLGRTANAGDLLGHSVDLSSIFLPFKDHLMYPFYDAIIPDLDMHWEDMNYIGLFTSLFLILFTILFISRINFRRAMQVQLSEKGSFILLSLFSSALLLLFAMDIPFRWGMEDWLQGSAISVIKDFRANGRFGWAFYYVFTTSAFFLLDRMLKLYKVDGSKIIYYGIIILLPFSMMIEGAFNHGAASKRLSGHPNLFGKGMIEDDLLYLIEEIDPETYQAILPIPFFHSGSQNYERYFRPDIFRFTLQSSFHSGIPTLAAQLTRVAIPESKMILQSIGPAFYKKDLDTYLKDSRPILIISSREPKSKYEKEILSKADLLFEGEDFMFWSITKSNFLGYDPIKQVKEFSILREDLYARDGFLMTDSTSVFRYNSSSGSAGGLLPDGGYAISEDSILLDLDASLLSSKIYQHFSMWVYNCGENFGQDALQMKINIIGLSGSEETKLAAAQPRLSHVINDCWSLVEIPFKINEGTDRLRVELNFTMDSPEEIYVDGIMLRNARNKVYSMEDDLLFFNNHRIDLSQ